MDFDTLVGTAELIGATVVVISLVYVGVQIRQNTNMAAGAAQRELMNSFQAQLDRIVSEAETYHRGLAGLEYLTDTEKIKFQLIFNQFINHLEQALRMKNRGLETQDNVDIYGDICMTFIQSTGGMEVWNITKELYFPQSRMYVQNRLDDPDGLPPPLAQVADWFVYSGTDQS